MGELLDSTRTTFGLRSIELAPNPNAPRDSAPWTFVVNGVTEFIRGANWVPADAIPARMTRSSYSELITLARDSGINLLRVWGGGLREKKAFYDLCDESGILVWQDFPFSGSGFDYFPRDAHFFALVHEECTSIVRSLRNHPSVALWCGGNEFFPRLNRKLVSTLRRVVSVHDGTRPFKPASPSRDESHNWRVWHGLANTRDYQRDKALFFGEFGLQALPQRATMERFLPQDSLYPPNPIWEYHNAELGKLWRYALAVNPAIKTLDEFIEASQVAQMRALQIAVEHARRNKPRVSGCVLWQFNEPWFSICWSILDYARAPKRAYLKLKELYNPVLVSFEYELRPRGSGDSVSGYLWLVNDTTAPVNGMVRVWHNDLLVFEQDVQVGANKSARLAPLSAVLHKGENALRLVFMSALWGSTNEYDLNYCDTGEISSRAESLAALSHWLRTSA